MISKWTEGDAEAVAEAYSRIEGCGELSWASMRAALGVVEHKLAASVSSEWTDADYDAACDGYDAAVMGKHGAEPSDYLAIRAALDRVKHRLARPSVHDQVTEFHVAMGAPIGEKPAELTRERLEFRLSLIAEECLELLDAAGYTLTGREDGKKPTLQFGQLGADGRWRTTPFDMVEVADALGDLDYVVEGMRLELGIDGAPIAAEIHRTNMLKSTGPVRADGKKLKPEGWLPPDIRACLVAQGWTPRGEP